MGKNTFNILPGMHAKMFLGQEHAVRVTQNYFCNDYW